VSGTGFAGKSGLASFAGVSETEAPADSDFAGFALTGFPGDFEPSALAGFSETTLPGTSGFVSFGGFADA
jgi:hypothetical protein